MDLSDFRARIDEIDAQLTALYRQRMEIADAVGAYKRAHGLPVLDAARERALLARIAQLAGPSCAEGAQALYRLMLAQSRSRQAPVYGLVGEHLSHSFSPRLHKLLGGYAYSLIELSREELPAFFARREFCGVNVTIPYKRDVPQYLDVLSDTARRTGSVNTVIREENGMLRGENTDYDGFLWMLRRSEIDAAGRKCLVLGSGGASATVCACLQDLGAAEVRVISRKGPDTYETLDRHADAEILVNATPVGMYPNGGAMPADPARFPKLRGVVDLIYHPLRTALLLRAEALGIPCVGGLSMLTAQAARACALFCGKETQDGEIRDVTAQLAREAANLVLIGMPGSGKTTLGEALASRLCRPFVDTDQLIEKRTGCSCGAFLHRYGEAAFRELESEVVRNAGQRTGCVIATGGGVVTRPENLPALRQNGVIFHLDLPLEALSREGDHPLSANEAQLARLYAQRAPLYRAWRDYALPAADAETAALLFAMHWEEKLP